MQKKIAYPESDNSESYQPFEFTEFLQENWLYLVIVLIIIFLVIMFVKKTKDKKNSNKED